MIWKARAVAITAAPSVEFSCYKTPDSDPNRISVTATYFLTDQNELRIQYVAYADHATRLNLESRGCFNLSGGMNILNHVVTIPCRPLGFL